MPVTGGSNVPALNMLLAPWKIALSDRVFEGDFTLGDRDMYYATGTSIAHFPAHGHLVRANLADLGHEMLEGETRVETGVPLLGLLQTKVVNLFDASEVEKEEEEQDQLEEDHEAPIGAADGGKLAVQQQQHDKGAYPLNAELMNMDDTEHNVATEVDSLDVFRHNHNLDINNNNLALDAHPGGPEDENTAKENNNNVPPFAVNTNRPHNNQINRSHDTGPNINNDNNNINHAGGAVGRNLLQEGGEGYNLHHDGGRVIVYGDSNCLDNSHLQKDCLWLLAALLEYSTAGHLAGVFTASGKQGGVGDNYSPSHPLLPKRMEHSTLHKHSKVCMLRHAAASLGYF